MARTTQEYSMTVASIASKMSLVIPVLFSLLILGTRSRDYTLFNYTGILLGFLAILLSSLRNRPGESFTSGKTGLFLLPLSVFVLGGTIDTLLNTVNHRYLSPEEEGIFPIFIFLTAGVIGMIVLLAKRAVINFKSVIGGLFLGMVNYFSVYFLLMALRQFDNDGAFVYPMVNVGIILISALISGIFFREKFHARNIAGLLLAVISIILLSHQELISFLF
jgi:drug/metabolite transporter (DMT)-like permease